MQADTCESSSQVIYRCRVTCSTCTRQDYASVRLARASHSVAISPCKVYSNCPSRLIDWCLAAERRIHDSSEAGSSVSAAREHRHVPFGFADADLLDARIEHVAVMPGRSAPAVELRRRRPVVPADVLDAHRVTRSASAHLKPVVREALRSRHRGAVLECQSREGRVRRQCRKTVVDTIPIDECGQAAFVVVATCGC